MSSNIQKSLVDTLIKASTYISKRTRQSNGDYIICDSNTAEFINSYLKQENRSMKIDALIDNTIIIDNDRYEIIFKDNCLIVNNKISNSSYHIMNPNTKKIKSLLKKINSEQDMHNSNQK